MPNNAVALSRLFLAERNSLIRRLRRMLGGNDHAAEDITQSLWLKIQQIDDHPPILHKRAYLFRLASNMAVDAAKTERRRGEVHAEAMAFLHEGVDHLSSERIVLAQKELQTIRAAIDTLPELTRQAFMLSRVEGMPQREIAEKLGVSRPTVEKYLRRAFDAVSTALAGKS